MLYKLKRNIKFQKLRILWKIRNKHNRTYPESLFNIDRVCVGKGTYGPIRAISYECKDSELKIGNYCSIGGETLFLLGGEHNYNSFSTYPFAQLVLQQQVDTTSKGPIIIEDDVWIGERVTILSGVHVGQGAIIATGAVVTKDVPPYTIVGGVPSREIKKRFSQEIINKLMRVDFNKINKDFIEKNINKLNKDLKDFDFEKLLPQKGEN